MKYNEFGRLQYFVHVEDSLAIGHCAGSVGRQAGAGVSGERALRRLVARANAHRELHHVAHHVSRIDRLLLQRERLLAAEHFHARNDQLQLWNV